MDEHFYIFYLLTLFAEIIGTVGGFGSSVFFVPLASLFFNFHEVLGITSLLHVFSNISKIYLFRKGFNWDIFKKIGISSIIFVIIGAYLSKYIESRIAELILGIFLILYASFLLLRPQCFIKPSTPNAVLGGGLAGLMAGLLGTGGAIRGLTLASFNLHKDMFLATSALIDFGVDFSRFIIYFGQEYITKSMWVHTPMLLIISFVGSYIGKILLGKISQDSFKKLALWLILCVGVYSVYNYLKI